MLLAAKSCCRGKGTEDSVPDSSSPLVVVVVGLVVVVVVVVEPVLLSTTTQWRIPDGKQNPEQEEQKNRRNQN